MLVNILKASENVVFDLSFILCFENSTILLLSLSFLIFLNLIKKIIESQPYLH